MIWFTQWRRWPISTINIPHISRIVDSDFCFRGERGRRLQSNCTPRGQSKRSIRAKKFLKSIPQVPIGLEHPSKFTSDCRIQGVYPGGTIAHLISNSWSTFWNMYPIKGLSKMYSQQKQRSIYDHIEGIYLKHPHHAVLHKPEIDWNLCSEVKGHWLSSPKPYPSTPHVSKGFLDAQEWGEEATNFQALE